MKHAFLIIAHQGKEDLFHLLRSIDDARSDVYLHFDKRWKDAPSVEELCTVLNNSSFFLTPRIAVRWGGDSQIRAELLLLQTALSHGEYSFFHLLSGQDICLKPQDELYDYFSAHEGEIFLSFQGKHWTEDAQKRVKYYYFRTARKGFWHVLNGVSRRIQRVFGVDRRTKGICYTGGSNWASMPPDFCKCLTDHSEEILRAFSHTFCADEIYKHTVAYNSSFRERIHLLRFPDDMGDECIRLANLRYIDWVRGGPYTFREEDFDELVSSPCFFARKVSSENGLPEKILNMLAGR